MDPVVLVRNHAHISAKGLGCDLIDFQRMFSWIWIVRAVTHLMISHDHLLVLRNVLRCRFQWPTSKIIFKNYNCVLTFFRKGYFFNAQFLCCDFYNTLLKHVKWSCLNRWFLIHPVSHVIVLQCWAMFPFSNSHTSECFLYMQMHFFTIQWSHVINDSSEDYVDICCCARQP